MKTVFAILTLISAAASISLACDQDERCVPPEEAPVIGRPASQSSHVGKTGVVCSVTGARVQFAVTKNSLELQNLDTKKSESYALSSYIIRNGNEELSGGNKNASHTIMISQMETAVAIIFEISRGHDLINTSLDSRLCK